MRRFLIAFVMACLSSVALATLDVRDRTLEQRISSQKKYSIPWVPTQRKWIPIKLIGGDDKTFQTITLLYPSQACSVLIPRDGEIACYWHWQFFPDAPRAIHDDEAIVNLGSYFAWVTEQDYCDMVKGSHLMSSPKINTICRESWFEFFQEREGIPEALKIMVLPPY